MRYFAVENGANITPTYSGRTHSFTFLKFLNFLKSQNCRPNKRLSHETPLHAAAWVARVVPGDAAVGVQRGQAWVDRLRELELRQPRRGEQRNDAEHPRQRRYRLPEGGVRPGGGGWEYTAKWYRKAAVDDQYRLTTDKSGTH